MSPAAPGHNAACLRTGPAGRPAERPLHDHRAPAHTPAAQPLLAALPPGPCASTTCPPRPPCAPPPPRRTAPVAPPPAHRPWSSVPMRTAPNHPTAAASRARGPKGAPRRRRRCPVASVYRTGRWARPPAPSKRWHAGSAAAAPFGGSASREGGVREPDMWAPSSGCAGCPDTVCPGRMAYTMAYVCPGPVMLSAKPPIRAAPPM